MDALTHVEILPASQEDISGILDLLTPNAKNHSVLPRTAEDIRLHLGNFLVMRKGSELIGCVALRGYEDGLFEIRSLVVSDRYKGCGLGSALILGVLAKGRERGATDIFTLTIRPNLFRRLGFTEVPIQDFHRNDKFHEKIWSDCRLCPKFTACNETALTIHLD